MPNPDFQINFVIIGAAKAGTTSLAMWLANHPECCLSHPKETMFFGSGKLHSKGLDWYRKTYYPHYSGERVVGEATPAYSDHENCPEAPGWVHAHNPEARIIYMVRNPLLRTISAWRMWASIDGGRGDFADYLARKANAGINAWLEDEKVYRHVVETNRYRYQWQFWSCFPAPKRLVIFAEDLRQDKENVLKEVSDFLCVDYSALLESSSKNYNTGEERVSKTAFRKYLEENKLWQIVKRGVPGKLKASVASSKLGSQPLKAEEEDMNPEIRKRLLADLAEDNRGFLEEHGKPADYWHRNKY